MSRTDVLTWNQPGDLGRKTRYETNPAQEQVAVMLNQIGRAISGLGDRWNNLTPEQQRLYVVAAVTLTTTLALGGAIGFTNHVDSGHFDVGHTGTGIAHAGSSISAGTINQQPDLGTLVGPGYQSREPAPMCKPGDALVVAPRIEKTAAPATCNEVLFNTINTKGGVNFKPGAEVAILGNPVNWDNAQVNLAKRYFGGEYQSILDYVRGLPGDIQVQKVVRTGGEWSVVLTRGNKEVWAVDANGQFLGKQDGSLGGRGRFADLPTVPQGLDVVRKVDSGCSLTYAVDRNGIAKYAFNPLYGKWNTIGQLLGVEPSNQQATKQARLDNPVAVAASLGIEGCANCQFVPTEWGQRLDDPKLGTVAWQVGGKWEAAKDCVDPKSLRNADIRNKTGFRAIFNGKMCSSEPITDEIQIKDGLGNVIGKNRLGFVYLYKAPDTGKSAMLFVSLVVEDVNGQLIAMDWSKSAMCPGNPLDCYAGKISQKGIGINFYGTREDYDITVQKLRSRNAYPVKGTEEEKTLDFEGNFYVGRSGIPNKIRTGSLSEVLISAGFDSAFYR